MRSTRALATRALAAAILLSGATAAQAQFPGSVPNTFRLAVLLKRHRGVHPRVHAARGELNFGFLGFDFGYVGFSRSRTTTISQDIVFGDATYTAGATVEATQKTQLPYADIRFNFLHNSSTQLGLTLGVAYPILKAGLNGEGTIVGPGGPIAGQAIAQEAKIETPVPLLGIVFDAALGNDVSAGIVFNGIFAPVHPYTGSIFQADAHVDWYFANNFGVGGAFNYTRFRIKKDDLPETLVDFRHDFYGPRAYLIVTF